MIPFRQYSDQEIIRKAGEILARYEHQISGPVSQRLAEAAEGYLDDGQRQTVVRALMEFNPRLP